MHICLHLDDVIILWEFNNRANFGSIVKVFRKLINVAKFFAN